MVESPEQIAALPEPLHTQVIDTLSYAIRGVFMYAFPVMVVAWITSFFLKEIPLRSSSGLERSKTEGDAAEAAEIEAAVIVDAAPIVPRARSNSGPRGPTCWSRASCCWAR